MIKFAPEDCTFGNRMTIRDQFSYEQFVTWKWKMFIDGILNQTLMQPWTFRIKKSGYNLAFEPT